MLKVSYLCNYYICFGGEVDSDGYCLSSHFTSDLKKIKSTAHALNKVNKI